MIFEELLGQQLLVHPEDFWGTQSGETHLLFILQRQKNDCDENQRIYYVGPLIIIRIKCMIC